MAKYKKNKKKRDHKKSKRLRRPPKTGIKEESIVEMLEYKITDEPIDIWDVPEEIAAEVEDIYNQTQTDPENVIPRLQELLDIYPNVPQLYNYLSVAYSQLGKKEETEKIVKKNYKINPTYLFAKLNYAEICMQKDNLDRVPEILEGKFDIKALYPHRDTFHITEVVGFWGVAGRYFAAIGETDTAKLFYNNLKELVPDHPYTKQLKHHFLISSIKNTFNNMIFKKKPPRQIG